MSEIVRQIIAPVSQVVHEGGRPVIIESLSRTAVFDGYPGLRPQLIEQPTRACRIVAVENQKAVFRRGDDEWRRIAGYVGVPALAEVPARRTPAHRAEAAITHRSPQVRKHLRERDRSDVGERHGCAKRAADDYGVRCYLDIKRPAAAEYCKRGYREPNHWNNQRRPAWVTSSRSSDSAGAERTVLVGRIARMPAMRTVVRKGPQ